MDKDIQELIQQIHAQPQRIVFVTAGAGTYALAWLLGVPGASGTLIESLVPYDWTAFDDFLGQTPQRYVEAETARLLAGRAFTRARWLVGNGEDLIGLACTATIVTNRPKKGDHRAHVSIWSPERVIWQRLVLQKGARDRAGEETLVSRLILNVLAGAMGLPDQLNLPLIAGDTLIMGETNLSTLVNQLISAKGSSFYLLADGTLSQETPPVTILSGSFNPLHDGHLSLAQTAAEISGLPPAFGLTVVNADKPALPLDEALQCVAQFAGRWPVLVNNAPTFAEKALLYPGSTFVVGFDTAARVLEWRFYEGNQAKLEAAMEQIRQQRCRFLVAGREDGQGNFQEAYELQVPAHFADLFEPIPSHRFRRDISSTYLRSTGQRGSR